ncbi:hypothetical protein [Rossellomorea marisflavi]|uniref:hypothetical protein n=1 Tax=Rossellomorea marisflavi TaxID=189381 RepID=UPI003FA01EAE
MNEFLRRLKETVIKSASTLVAFVAMLLFTLVLAGVVIILPIWLLSFLIDDYSALWMLVLPVLLMADKIYKWFRWQFIEPFTK